MKSTFDSTRRQFLSKAGVALSAPVAVAAANASAGAIDEDAALKARLARLEDANAIRELQLACARHLNAGAQGALEGLFVDPAQARLGDVCSLTLDAMAEDMIDVLPDGTAAGSRVPCALVTATPIEPSWPLVEMARAQGGGVARRAERGMLESTYVKQHGTWRIERCAFVPE